jgi:CheY-like chemotaxis protein
MGGTPVVLVVEDEWLLRDCMAAHLRVAGWRVHEVGTGEAAVSLLEAGKAGRRCVYGYSIGRAYGSDWEVGARFRKALPQIPIIYTSGDAPRAEHAVPKSLFFAKPYEPDAIIDACRTYLREGRQS